MNLHKQRREIFASKLDRQNEPKLFASNFIADPDHRGAVKCLARLEKRVDMSMNYTSQAFDSLMFFWECVAASVVAWLFIALAALKTGLAERSDTFSPIFIAAIAAVVSLVVSRFFPSPRLIAKMRKLIRKNRIVIIPEYLSGIWSGYCTKWGMKEFATEEQQRQVFTRYFAHLRPAFEIFRAQKFDDASPARQKQIITWVHGVMDGMRGELLAEREERRKVERNIAAQRDEELARNLRELPTGDDLKGAFRHKK